MVRIIIQTIIIVILFISMILFPKQIFNASLRGIDAWLNIVFPALFPFFVVSEFFMSFGIVHFLGVLLEPIMRPLFNVPGSGAFVMAVGYTSGAPIGSIITSKLRKDSIISKVEAERLVSFTNNASPLFMLGAIAVGMLKNPSLGITIAASHYLANILLGFFLLRHWGKKTENNSYFFSQKNIFKKAYLELIKAQKKQNKPFGGILKSAIQNSLNNIILIGGFIILFSAIIELCNIFGILDGLASIFKFLLSLDNDVAKAIAAGLIEMTVGAKIVSETDASLPIKIASISMILGWSGISIHAQVLAMINDTDISFFPFIITRLLHGPLAAIISLIIFQPVKTVSKIYQFTPMNYFNYLLYNFITFFLIIILFCFFSILIYNLRRILSFL